jgi:glycosyltransferase involved in cell wall biosynthesis
MKQHSRPMPTMKVLFILPYQVVPPNSGNKNLTANLLKFMTYEISCDVVMLTDVETTSDSSIKCLRQAYPHIQDVVVFKKPRGLARTLERVKAILCGYHPSLGSHMSSQLQSWLVANRQKYDLIHFDMIHTSLYRDSSGDIASLLVASDAYSMAARESARLLTRWKDRIRVCLEAWLLSNIERRQYRKFDVVCSVSERDASYLTRQLNGLTVKTIGIGLGDEYSQRDIVHFGQVSSQKVEILITGSLDHEGVAMGTVKFIRECFPALKIKHPSLRVTLLGKNPHTLILELLALNPDLVHVNFVQNYAAFLDQDWVYVYPQQCATGLQTKVQQAMALGLPVVGYPVSFGGLNVRSGQHCYICQDTNEFTQSIDALLSNSLNRIVMGKEAAAHVRELFSIDRIGSEMMSMYRLALEEFRPPP